MLLLVGLGNPNPDNLNNRHNVGFSVIDAINEKFAACANIVPVNSIYSWKNSIESSNEFLVIFKTTSSNISKLRDFISDRHGYDIPEIIDFELDNVNDSYLNWMIQSTL